MDFADIFDILCDDILIQILCYNPFVNLTNLKVLVEDKYICISNNKKKLIVSIEDKDKIPLCVYKHRYLLNNIIFTDGNIKYVRWILNFFKFDASDSDCLCYLANIITSQIVVHDNIKIFKTLYKSMKNNINNIPLDILGVCIDWNCNKIIKYIIEETEIKTNENYPIDNISRPYDKPFGFDLNRKNILYYLKSKNKISDFRLSIWDYILILFDQKW